MGLKIGPIRLKQSNAEVTEEVVGLKIGPMRPNETPPKSRRKRGGVGLKIGPIRPKRSNAEVTEEGGWGGPLLAALNDEFVALVRNDEHKKKESGRGHVVVAVLVPRKPPE